MTTISSSRKSSPFHLSDPTTASLRQKGLAFDFAFGLEVLRFWVPHMLFRHVGFFTWLEQSLSANSLGIAVALEVSAGAPHAGFSVWEKQIQNLLALSFYAFLLSLMSPASATCSSISNPYPSSATTFFGWFVNTLILVSPKSINICAPIPLSLCICLCPATTPAVPAAPAVPASRSASARL